MARYWLTYHRDRADGTQYEIDEEFEGEPDELNARVNELERQGGYEFIAENRDTGRIRIWL